MARKLRIQYEGALYHVINRGNYRRDIFGSAGAAQAFEAALWEACAVNGWRLHAFVLMRNHYHLALETPRANLVEGMHWLQSTFATRFNRLRQARGHLFQGRYQALLIEDRSALARVVDYIHLNPVRAKLLPPERVAEFRWSSLHLLLHGPRPPALSCQDWLEAHGLTDSSRGLRAYAKRLGALAADETEQKRQGLEQLSQGWAIGTAGWRRALAKDYADRALAPGLEAGELRDLKESRWTEVLEQGLKRHRQSREAAAASHGSLPWKLTIAQALRQVGAPYAWITAQLHMGKPGTVRVYLHSAKPNT
jgi:putative transposase